MLFGLGKKNSFNAMKEIFRIKHLLSLAAVEYFVPFLFLVLVLFLYFFHLHPSEMRKLGETYLKSCEIMNK